MAAAEFQRLLSEFRGGWFEVGDKLFNLEILVPGGYSVGLDAWFARLPANDQDRERARIGPENFPLDHPPYNRETHELIAKVCLPYTDKPDTEFTLDGFAVVRKDEHILTEIKLFKRLCGEAGANLPDSIREMVYGYCPWECREPGSWWIALLANYHQLRAYNDLGAYQVEHPITRPWLSSIELIEKYKLSVDSQAIGSAAADESQSNIPPPPLTDAQQEVFNYIKEHGPKTGKEIVAALGLSGESALTTHLIPPLKPRGIVNKPGRGYYYSPS